MHFTWEGGSDSKGKPFIIDIPIAQGNPLLLNVSISSTSFESGHMFVGWKTLWDRDILFKTKW